MKILLISTPFIPIPVKTYGGIERVVQNICPYLAEMGHEIILVAHHNSNTPYTLEPWPEFAVKKRRIKTNLLIREIAKKYNPDIIHDFTVSSYLVPSKFKKIISFGFLATITDMVLLPIISGSSKLVGCSNYITRTLPTFVNKTTIYNPLDTKLYDCNAIYNPDAPLAIIGRIERNKGIHNAIKIAERLDKELIIAGNITPPHQKYFAEEIQPKLSSKIKFVGEINDVQKNEILTNSSAFLMPIEWDEPFGIVMAEAMACGTPVVGFRRGAIPEVVNHGKTGFIGDTIDDLINYIPKLNEINRAECRRWVEEKFASEIIAKQYVELYKEMTTPYIKSTKKNQKFLSRMIEKLLPWMG